MFPEFATIFRDNDNKVHLYIFPGIDKNGKQIYKNIDLSSINAKYTYNKKSDNAIEFIFETNIKKLECNLIHATNNSTRKFVFKNI